MDFFKAQDKARQSTTRLVILFGVAVATLIVMTNILVMAVLGFYSSTTGNDAVTGRYLERAEQGQTGTDLLGSMYFDAFVRAFDWQVFIGVGAIVLIVVVLGSTFKIIALSTGGKVVAEMLGGQRILSNTNDPEQRKVLNVVEEMAIASGSPVPSVFLLPEESSINAFAAGNSPGDAIIGVTQGCIKLLNRDQLQGVIAHEFSHILNGDMRLNIRIMGILHGILIIGMIGYHLLHSTRYSRRREGGGGLFILGFGLMVIGFAGSFFGSMIKASVSRQREYLADASAVQFTRNPDGIANALKKIGGFSRHSKIDNPAAPAISHAFFASGVKSLFTDLFSTHPPLEKRIREIQPAWDGKFPTIAATIAAGRESYIDQSDEPLNNLRNDFSGREQPLNQTIIATAALDAINAIGQPSPQHLAYAKQLRAHTPESIVKAVQNPYGARAVIYALIISRDTTIQQIQLDHIKQHADTGIYELTKTLLNDLDPIDATQRLPLIDSTVATLRELSTQQYKIFKENFQILIAADKKISLFEWALQNILFRYLDAEFFKHSILASTGKYSNIKPVIADCVFVLSVLAHSEHKNFESAKLAFKKGMELLQQSDATIIAKDKLSLTRLSNSIDRLNLLKPLVKPQFLKACAACITSDNYISPSEAELLRAFSAALDCPMPPLIANQKNHLE